MRIRTIKPEFFLHEGLFDLEKQTQLPIRISFSGLWCAADREGRFHWKPRKLKAQILPYDDVDFSRVLDALATRGFLVKYASGGVDYGCIPSFKRHQYVNPREKPSELPPPPETSNGQQVDASLTRASRDNDACLTPLSLPFHSLPVPEGSAEGNNDHQTPAEKSPIFVLQERLNALMKRTPGSRWSYEEEYSLTDVAKRPECLSELSEVEGWFKKPDAQFLPQSLSSLLTKWTGHLDRARKHDETIKRNTPKRFDASAGTSNAGVAASYANAPPNYSGHW